MATFLAILFLMVICLLAFMSFKAKHEDDDAYG